MRGLIRGWLFAAILLSVALIARAQGVDSRDLVELSLEELSNLKVTSVSGRAERLSEAPASIYVITGEDIRRSGVTSLPEALRLAPNLQVARIDAAQYSISARGFNNAIGNKLLVLIDGRTIYTPLFSGVFWDMQDVLLEEVERIEVISGPGATLWGANAVNGVINVITRPAGETRGTLATAGSGDPGSGVALRHGWAAGGGAGVRVYAKADKVENTDRRDGTELPDDWHRFQAGFRADWGAGRDRFTLQGDAYDARTEDRGVAAGIFVLGRVEVSGHNLLARWSRRLQNGSDLQVQAYLDHSKRVDALLFQPESDIYDIELKHGIALEGHKVLWGMGYRHGKDEVEDGLLLGIGFRPQSRELDWANVFVQDEIELSTEVKLTAGLKLEDNDYTGLEHLPSLRLAWTRTPHQLFWAALSRAVRAPARLDRDLSAPGIILGGPEFESEIAVVTEVGMRAQPAPGLSYSATLFWHEWDKLRSGQPPPALIQNMIEGTTYGMEAWGTWQPLPDWRLSLGLITLRKDLKLKPGSTDPTGPSALGNDPDYQWTARASWTPAPGHELDVLMRRVDELTNPQVPAYLAVDMNYGWRMRRDLEVSLRLQNMFDPSHAEFGSAPDRSEIARGAFLKLRWTP
jgi:iron complex outermembrane receptor protein